VEYNAHEEGQKVVNEWLQEDRGLPVTLGISKLGLRIIGALKAAYEAGQQSQQKTEQQEPSTDQG